MASSPFSIADCHDLESTNPSNSLCREILIVGAIVQSPERSATTPALSGSVMDRSGEDRMRFYKIGVFV